MKTKVIDLKKGDRFRLGSVYTNLGNILYEVTRERRESGIYTFMDYKKVLDVKDNRLGHTEMQWPVILNRTGEIYQDEIILTNKNGI